MYIDPNSRIILLADVPIDKDQTDTLYFASESAQVSYFMSKQIKGFPKCTYNRPNRNYTRVDCNAAQIYQCNYMMFQNTSYGSKWFYAFINNVEYINDNVSEINFTIDPVQTWFFNYKTEECFIERIHALRDAIGNNIVPEPVDTGEMVLNGDLEEAMYDTTIYPWSDNLILLLYVDPEEIQSGWVIDDIFTAAQLYYFNPEFDADVALLKQFIESNVEHPDAIIAIYMIPSWAVDINYVQGHIVTGGNTTPFTLPYEALTENDTLDGYKPKNKKMYTYPYNSFFVLGGSGNSMSLRYEFFENLAPELTFYSSAFPPVSINVFPANYKGAAEYRNETLTISGFPQCAWSTDAYKAWMAQNSVPIKVGNTGIQARTPIAGIEAAFNAISGNIGAGIHNITNTLKNGYQASIAADITKGTFEHGNAEFSSKYKKFYYSRLSCQNTYAKRIDDFFTMFGYAVNDYGTPSRHHRSRFTYVKTINAQIAGNLPADDAEYIAGCYNKGIRFWADLDHVGDYNLDNMPLGN